MNQKQNKSNVELMLDTAFKVWNWHNALKEMTKGFVSSDTGQQLLEAGMHLLRHIDFDTIVGCLQAAFQF